MGSKVLVVGSGVIGLRTALELLRRGRKVVLRSPRNPLHPATCSQGAGGLWMPFHCDDPRTDRWAIETLDEIFPFAKDSQNSSVELLPTITLHRDHHGPAPEDFQELDYKDGRGGKSPKLPPWSTDPRLQFQHLTVEMLSWQNYVYKLRIPTQQQLKDAGYLYSWFFQAPIVDAPNMLMKMLEEIQSKAEDINVETGLEYESVQHMVEDAAALGCDAVVNATGLGASKICNDEHLVGARGILHHYDRETCVRKESIHQGEFGMMLNDAVILTDAPPYGTETEPAYLIVRGNIIVAGGSYLEGDPETGIRPEEHARLLRNAELLGIDTTKSKPIGEWTGFRPYRPTARCEIDKEFGVAENVKVVHSYGYGGSGWTVYVGAAKEAADLLLSKD